MIITFDILQIKEKERHRIEKDKGNTEWFSISNIENRYVSLILYTKYYAFIEHWK